MTLSAPGVPAASVPRTVHVEHCMGTVFTVDVRGRGDWQAAIGAVVAWLHRVDTLFSTYRPDSEISRIRRGELPVAGADPLVSEVLTRCAQLEAETGGWFTAYWRGAAPDPTGLVKGWAIERASDLLRDHGSRNHAVNGGGDVQTAGEAAPGQPWRIGIVDPFDRSRILTVVTGRDLAVATSGIAERGAHIVDPRTGIPSTGLASVSMAGRSLARTDAYATAAVAMGPRACWWAGQLPWHQAVIVASDGTMTSTGPALGQSAQIT